MLVALVYRILVCFYEVRAGAKVCCGSCQESRMRNPLSLTCQLFTMLNKVYNTFPLRLCAFGEQEEPLQGSFSLDSELSHVTHQFWFSQTGYLWCQQLTSLCQREWQEIIFLKFCCTLSQHSLSSCNRNCCVCPSFQINCPSLEQELLDRLLFPGLHHTSLLPAQQDCVRYGCWYNRCQAVQAQMTLKWTEEFSTVTRTELRHCFVQ